MAPDDTSLDSLFDAPPAAAQTETAPAAPEPTGEKETAAAPPADAQAPSDDGPLVPRRALEDERRKRQDYERRLADMERKLQASAQPQQAPPAAPPADWWTDPEAAAQRMQAEHTYAIFETRLSLGEEIMSQKPDYEAAKAAFIEAAQADMDLTAKMVKSANPAKFVYEQGRKLQAMREIGDDPVSYRQRLEEEFKAKYLAPQPVVSQPPKAPAPKSLAGTPSTARDPQGRFASSSGPASLEDLLG